MKDYYKILEVNKEASQEVITKIYRILAKKYHPDSHPENLKEAEEKFKEISEAYEILSNEEKRKKYDAELEEEQASINPSVSIEDYNSLLQHCEELESYIASYKANNNASAQKSNNTSNSYQSNTASYSASSNSNDYYNQAKAQAEEKAYQDAINKAYHDSYINSLKNLGYKIRYKQTFKQKMKNLLALIITFAIVFVIAYILWHIPSFREQLKDMFSLNSFF